MQGVFRDKNFQKAVAVVSSSANAEKASKVRPRGNSGTKPASERGSLEAPPTGAQKLPGAVALGKIAFDYNVPLGGQTRLLRPKGRVILNYSSISTVFWGGARAANVRFWNGGSEGGFTAGAGRVGKVRRIERRLWWWGGGV